MTIHSLHFVLFAVDVGEIIGAIVVGLIALFFWVIQKVAGANKQVAGQRPRPAAPGAEAQAGEAAAARPAGQQADPLRNQVEEFLRRAGKMQQGGQAGPPQRPRPQGQPGIEVLLKDDAAAPERRQLGAPLRPTESRPTSKPSVAATPAVAPSPGKTAARRLGGTRKRKSLAERAGERAAARAEAIAKQVSNLGQRIVAEDQQFDVQLKSKFDHAVGTLAGSATSDVELVPVETDTPAAQIARMLAAPEGVRQAIVLNEILHRPTDRW